ncbi:MAG: prephenate dehydratase [Saprospiraceae bacterium]|nr:prephenate dehydratase [Saprospiraceae bacterium]
MKENIAIQGYAGSFHDEVCRLYFGDSGNAVPADSFNILGSMLSTGKVDSAIMAIENSIAGTLLQNYRILREAGFWIAGEKYLRIQHNLMSNPGTQIMDIKEVHSHPMALNQCLAFLRQYDHIKLVETEDTALSAMYVRDSKRTDLASISSLKAASLYGLEVLEEGIETNKTNYTRFFILKKERQELDEQVDKASIYIRIPDVKGQLLKVLQVIDDHDLNMSKLQSFPVMGKLREYFFHIDIEFNHFDHYKKLKSDLIEFTHEYTELGIYKRDNSIQILTD